MVSAAAKMFASSSIERWWESAMLLALLKENDVGLVIRQQARQLAGPRTLLERSLEIERGDPKGGHERSLLADPWLWRARALHVAKPRSP